MYLGKGKVGLGRIFWALRGGSSGTFVVVTNAYIKLYDAKMVTILNINFNIVGIEK